VHPAPAFAWTDRDAVLALVARVAFVHLFAMTPAGPRVAHVPVLVIGERLRFHLSNGNALTRHLDGALAVASVVGTNAYISPNWYTGADQVPTWNYLGAEIEGRVARLGDDALIDLLDASAAEFEPRVGENWTRAKMDPARFTAMCGGITGFELATTDIRATAKLSQNKAGADFDGVIAGLNTSGHTEMADTMLAVRAK
jgi:transcriptional regulator